MHTADSHAKPAHACRVAIVEDHMLQRKRTEELMRQRGYRVVFSGESTPEFVAWVRSAPRKVRPHLLVLDLMVDRQPSVEVELVRRLLKAGLRIVVLSALASAPLVRAIVRTGVTGIVGKRDREEDLLSAIDAVLRGKVWMSSELAKVIAGDPERPSLSIQEERALVLYASGLTLEQVASIMNVKPATARQYLVRVSDKYTSAGIQAKSKLDLSRIAWVEGYAELTFLLASDEEVSDTSPE